MKKYFEKLKIAPSKIKAFVYEYLLTMTLVFATTILVLSSLKNAEWLNDGVVSKISSLSTFGIFLISILALEIIKTTRKEAQTRYKRESAKESITQIERFKKHILPSLTYSDIFSIPKFRHEKIKNFTKSEIETLNLNYGIELDKYLNNKKTDTLPGEVSAGLRKVISIQSAINEAEIFSFSIMSGLCDSKLMFPVCSNVFCSFVEGNYIHICDSRDRDGHNFYKNTIDLYNKWVINRKRNDLDEKYQEWKEESDTTPVVNINFLGEE